jgi:hypothetical protein
VVHLDFQAPLMTALELTKHLSLGQPALRVAYTLVTDEHIYTANPLKTLERLTPYLLATVDSELPLIVTNAQSVLTV